MRKANVYMHGVFAGVLAEILVELPSFPSEGFTFTYASTYTGPPISLTMPLRKTSYHYPSFPPFFDGLLPEGMMLEALLRQQKIDRHDHFRQLVTVGKDMVGAVTVEAAP